MKYFVDTLDELAIELGRSRRTLSGWAKEGCPCRPSDRDERGRYRVRLIAKWVDTHHPREPKVAAAAPTNGGTAGMSWRDREQRAKTLEREQKARLAEIERQRQEGELLSRSEVLEDMRRRIQFVKSGLLGLPKQLAPELAGKPPLEVGRILEKRIRALLEEFADGF